MSALKQNRKQILDIIFRHIPRDSCVVFIFGSFAKNKIYPSSDIDVGIICRHPLDNSALVKIKEEVNEEVKTLPDIDIVDFSTVQDKNFLKIALKEVGIWHQTKKSRAYLDNLKKLIAG